MRSNSLARGLLHPELSWSIVFPTGCFLYRDAFYVASTAVHTNMWCPQTGPCFQTRKHPFLSSTAQAPHGIISHSSDMSLRGWHAEQAGHGQLVLPQLTQLSHALCWLPLHPHMTMQHTLLWQPHPSESSPYNYLIGTCASVSRDKLEGQCVTTHHNLKTANQTNKSPLAPQQL